MCRILFPTSKVIGTSYFWQIKSRLGADGFGRGSSGFQSNTAIAFGIHWINIARFLVSLHWISISQVVPCLFLWRPIKCFVCVCFKPHFSTMSKSRRFFAAEIKKAGLHLVTSVDAAVKHLDFRLYKTQAAEIGGWGPVKMAVVEICWNPVKYGDLWNIRYNKDSYKPNRISWNIISLDLFLFKVILLRIRSHRMKIIVKPTTIKNLLLPSKKQIEEHYRTRMCFFCWSFEINHGIYNNIIGSYCSWSDFLINSGVTPICAFRFLVMVHLKKKQIRRAKRRGCFFYRKTRPQTFATGFTP